MLSRIGVVHIDELGTGFVLFFIHCILLTHPGQVQIYASATWVVGSSGDVGGLK